MDRIRHRRWPVLLLAVGALGVGIRIWNAFAYPLIMGFDAVGNWEYVELLWEEARLPAPHRGWSMGHPPLFYAMAALIGLVFDRATEPTYYGTRLVSSFLGVAAIAAVWLGVRRTDPAAEARALIAVALLLFLPVHIYMCAMFGEEILVSSLTTVVGVGLALQISRVGERRPTLFAASVLGVLAGLAVLTKLSGVLIVGAGIVAYAVDALRREDPTGRWLRPVVFALAAAAVGGWFFIRNWVLYGYIYPHALPFHTVMQLMPPGSRSAGDYLSLPLATFSDPNLVSPAMLRSVWGTTFATIWWDGHRHFLPIHAPGLRQLATVIALLALVPCTAFAVGVVRGLRRLLRERNPVDALWLSLIAATLSGYVLFTWQNPWFVTVKGSFLLGLGAPFAWYASEVLAGWMTAPQWRRLALVAALVLLWSAVSVPFSYGVAYEKLGDPGLNWKPASPLRQKLLGPGAR